MTKPTAEVIKKTLRSEMRRLYTDNVVAVCNIEGRPRGSSSGKSATEIIT